jgi:hypothetical protein
VTQLNADIISRFVTKRAGRENLLLAPDDLLTVPHNRFINFEIVDPEFFEPL